MTASLSDQLRKHRQGIQTNMCRIDIATSGTCDPVKHPERDFQRPVRPTASEIASKYRHTRFVDHLMDINRSAKPRMPAIKNLAPVVNVGVLAFNCTTPSAHIVVATSGTTCCKSISSPSGTARSAASVSSVELSHPTSATLPEHPSQHKD